jgi:hypothetical protein
MASGSSSNRSGRETEAVMLGYGYCPRCGAPLPGSRRGSCGNCDPRNGAPTSYSILTYGSKRTRRRIDSLLIGPLVGLAVLLAFGTYNARPESTPRSAASISCSSGQRVSQAVTLQASVEPDEQLQYELDGAPFAIITVSQYFERLPGGAWSNGASDNPLDGCAGPDGRLVVGTHQYRLLDLHGNVLAAVAFAVLP